jgi:response regulator RpfG family c-di-GMP phosphodiesterase
MLAFFAEESGRMFDPDLVAILLANVALFQKVAARFPDAAMDSCR